MFSKPGTRELRDRYGQILIESQEKEEERPKFAQERQLCCLRDNNRPASEEMQKTNHIIQPGERGKPRSTRCHPALVRQSPSVGITAPYIPPERPPDLPMVLFQVKAVTIPFSQCWYALTWVSGSLPHSHGASSSSIPSTANTQKTQSQSPVLLSCNEL